MKNEKSVIKWEKEITAGMERIGRNLKIIRWRTGESQQSYAAKWLGTDKAEAVGQIEKGIVPVKAAYICLLADELKINIEDIVSDNLWLDIGIDYILRDLYKDNKETANIIARLDEYNERIAKNIWQARCNSLITQKSLAERLGWELEKKISRLETVETKKAKALITIDDLIAISLELNLPLKELFNGCTEKRIYTLVMDNSVDIPLYSF